FVWKQNYILVDEYFFFCCTWIVNSADKTNAVNIFFDIETKKNLRVANNLPLVSRLNLPFGKYSLPYMYSKIFETFNPEIIVTKGKVLDIKKDNDGYDVTFFLEEKIEQIIHFSTEVFPKYNIKLKDVFEIVSYIPDYQRIMDLIRSGKIANIRSLKLYFIIIGEFKLVYVYKISK
ncbi:hypothetical protein, partial [Moraxella porci]|uniref:hypothetical protein n=1 Tax=Moraxella porci TaxID=1288392 RepID=UPI00244D6217